MPERHAALRGVNAALRGLISVYARLISPLMGPKCRFHPTCSAYAVQALERHGPLAGLWLVSRRILACHPWSRRPGIDPVPDQFEWRAFLSYKRRSPRNSDIHSDTNNEIQ